MNRYTGAKNALQKILSQDVTLLFNPGPDILLYALARTQPLGIKKFAQSQKTLNLTHGAITKIIMTWSMANIGDHLPAEVWESFINHHTAAGVLLGTLFLALSYPLIHNILLSKSQVYRENLDLGHQVVVLQHAIEAVFLSLIFIPYTYVTLSVNFEEQQYDSFKNKTTVICTFMSVVIIMYLMEIASRFANPRPLVVAHHLCAYLDGIIVLFFVTDANVKAASLLVYFITFEALTFVSLVMYRLCPTHRWTKPTILAGMVVFGSTRPIQFIWIIGSLLASWEHLVLWQAVFQITLTVVFTFLQLYTLTIHYTMYKKCGALKVQRAEPIKGVLDMDDQELGDDFDMDKTTPISMEFEV